IALALCAVTLAVALVAPNLPPAEAQQPAAPSSSADAGAPPAASAKPSAAPSGAPASVVGVATRGGLAPLPDDREVPTAWMPPGTSASPIPSDEVFPPQTLTLRFNHKKHVKELKQNCKVCHAAAYASDSSQDRLLPKPNETCDNCHDVDHSNLSQVKSGGEANGRCTYCHLGDRAGEGGRVAPLVAPRANLRFPHKKHLARNIQCGQCHGQIDQLELATREQL